MALNIFPYPIYENIVSKDMTLNNTTADVSLFTVSGGPIIIHRIYGVVTTALSNSHTSAGFRCTIGAGATNISAISGTMSSAVVGGIISAFNNGGAPLTAIGNVGGLLTGSGTVSGVPEARIINTITGQTTYTIVYRHTTTNTPESGTIEFHLFWQPIIPGVTVVNA